MLLSRGKKAPPSPLLGPAERTAAAFRAFESFIREPSDSRAALVLQAAICFEEELRGAQTGSGAGARSAALPAAERRLQRAIVRGLEEAVLAARLASDEVLRFRSDAAPFAPMAEALAGASRELAQALRKDKDWADALVRALKHARNFQALHRKALESALTQANAVTLLKTKELLKRFSDAGSRLGQAAEALSELLARNP